MTVKELIEQLQKLPKDQTVEVVFKNKATDYWSRDTVEETDCFEITNLYDKVQLDIT